MSPGDAGFRTVDTAVEWSSRVLRAERVNVEGPDGERFERVVVRHPGAVAIVPVLDDGAVVLVRQFRTAAGRALLEIPAGTRDVDGEPVEETARRELAEEAGLHAGSLEPLCEFFNAPGFCDERTHVFLARDLTPGRRDTQGAEERHSTIEHVALAEVPALISTGAIIDAKSIVGLLLVRERLGPAR